MTKYIKQVNAQKDILYNNILLLCRNAIFYTKFDLIDTFQNRINLIFLHMSFLFIKLKHKNENRFYKDFFQKMFDLTFSKIELNMREIGYGDVTVNKSMKLLVKLFYNILLNCENYKNKNLSNKKLFLIKYLSFKNNKKNVDNIDLVQYFDKYEAFCLDLTLDSVLKGDLNFNYN